LPRFTRVVLFLERLLVQLVANKTLANIELSILRPKMTEAQISTGHPKPWSVKTTNWENSMILMFPTISESFDGNTAMFVQFQTCI
jgi:hypothetical protein